MEVHDNTGEAEVKAKAKSGAGVNMAPPGVEGATHLMPNLKIIIVLQSRVRYHLPSTAFQR